MEFYVNNTRFTAKLSYNHKEEQRDCKTGADDRRLKLELPVSVADTENQSLLSNLGRNTDPSSVGRESLPPTTPRDDTTEFDLESVCSELDLESLPGDLITQGAEEGVSRKVPLIKLSSAPAETAPPSGRLALHYLEMVEVMIW
jgi:hypothetical protein